jgi:transposase
LSDAPRSGAPRKLQAKHVPHLREWARQEALSALQLQEKLRARFDFKVSTQVVQQALSREGFVWNRTRHWLKKRCGAAFGRAQRDIEALKVQAQ